MKQPNSLGTTPHRWRLSGHPGLASKAWKSVRKHRTPPASVEAQLQQTGKAVAERGLPGPRRGSDGMGWVEGIAHDWSFSCVSACAMIFRSVFFVGVWGCPKVMRVPWCKMILHEWKFKHLDLTINKEYFALESFAYAIQWGIWAETNWNWNHECRIWICLKPCPILRHTHAGSLLGVRESGCLEG